MNFINIPEGNGQKLYMDKEWVSKEFYDYLCEKCYDVYTDSALVPEDAFFITPCLDKHINSKKEDYVDKKMKKIKECFVGENIAEPLTIKFPIDHFPENLPNLPFVLKNIEENGGYEKFIIRTPEQLAKLKKFYEEANDYDFECRSKKLADEWKSLGNEIIFDRKNGHSNTGISMSIFDYKEIFNERMVIQDYIETPTKYNTSMRVMTSSTGEILCASLKYMQPSSPDPLKKYYGYFDTYLSNQESPYFLGNESIISNTVAGGNSILLGKDNYSQIEQEILSAHDIDPLNAVVPESVRRVATKIAIHCRREIGAISGMDFIYDNKTKTWKFLEQHEFPMLTSYAEKYGIPYPESGPDSYKIHAEVDFNARLHALTIYMKKKQQATEDRKISDLHK